MVIFKCPRMEFRERKKSGAKDINDYILTNHCLKEDSEEAAAEVMEEVVAIVEEHAMMITKTKIKNGRSIRNQT